MARPVDPNSDNQLIKAVLFGKDADKQSNTWRKWPEPQRVIYSRMFSNGLCFANLKTTKQLQNLVQTMADAGVLQFKINMA
jgi:hypothetical protein